MPAPCGPFTRGSPRGALPHNGAVRFVNRTKNKPSKRVRPSPLANKRSRTRERECKRRYKVIATPRTGALALARARTNSLSNSCPTPNSSPTAGAGADAGADAGDNQSLSSGWLSRWPWNPPNVVTCASLVDEASAAISIPGDMAAEASMKSFVTDGGERSVQDIVSKLKFIAIVKAGEKIDVSSLSIQGVTLAGRTYRTFIARGESRAATLTFLRATLGTAFDLASEYASRGDAFSTKIAGMIISALTVAKTGIIGLTETYRDDRMFVSRVDTLVTTLDAKIADLNLAVL